MRLDEELRSGIGFVPVHAKRRAMWRVKGELAPRTLLQRFYKCLRRPLKNLFLVGAGGL